MDFLHLSVAEFNQLFADIVHNQLQLNRLCIKGEITQINMYQNHLYLTLSHKNSHLNCVIYNSHKKSLPYLKKGDTCEVLGQCNYLKNKGQLIFSGYNIIQKGSGDKLQNQIEKIKKYEKIGLLDKKTINEIPSKIEKICLITSADSAAYFDIESIFNNTPHTFETILIPSTMQGLNAVPEIINALKIADSLNSDLICMTRGGGSENDFDCFFSDDIANEVIDLKTPLITGIGHKINTTLCCYLANSFFETPTALAQWLCNHSTLPLIELKDRLNNLITPILLSLETHKNSVLELKNRLNNSIMHNIESSIQLSSQLEFKLNQLNPNERLKNGFAYVSSSEQRPIKSIQDLNSNDTINLTFTDGKVEAVITNVYKEKT